ncbi:ImmA/IrrE family metallo-endopeptidase [Bacillus haynesii]|uniref:ImmA/IrrE family metallo-endopeptidase n=1 Tax=Bacillus haynesii TaxID=1925021 RepID=UPI002282BA5A|nr:ImmA/IrrE family metallo-endopeptidase [Bacillus haynesii]MCY9401651.1 ImmA/IrrE family metallo-endopeptidase [Bacillus haynesii]
MHFIKRKVNELVKRFNSNDPFEIAERLNIIVLFEDLGKTLGYYSSYKRYQFIHINNRLDETLHRPVCCHELGHAILHPNSNTPFLKSKTFYAAEKIEVEANKFTVEMLLPDEDILKYKNTNLSLKEIAQIHRVPQEICHLKKF